MDAIDILEAARGKIARPEGWGKGRRHFDRPVSTFCAAEAIEAQTEPGTDERARAMRAFYNAAGLDWTCDTITQWNDAPERTHAEVLAAFNLAIATLRL